MTEPAIDLDRVNPWPGRQKAALDSALQIARGQERALDRVLCLVGIYQACPWQRDELAEAYDTAMGMPYGQDKLQALLAVMPYLRGG